jgi:hypothetical protein
MAIWINSEFKEKEKDDFEPLSMAIGSAMKEDLKEEAKKRKDGSTIVGSSMKEDLRKKRCKSKK